VTEFDRPPAVTVSAAMPRALKTVLVIAVLQVIGNLAAGLLVVTAISSAAEHNQELASPGLAYLTVVVSFLAAAGLVVGAILVGRGNDRGRYLLIALECLTALGGVLTLVTGSVAGLVTIALAVVAITTLTRDTVQAWFELRGSQRRTG
jgi:hypothetical protein